MIVQKYIYFYKYYKYTVVSTFLTPLNEITGSIS